jgi:hypothetical protein
VRVASAPPTRRRTEHGLGVSSNNGDNAGATTRSGPPVALKQIDLVSGLVERERGSHAGRARTNYSHACRIGAVEFMTASPPLRRVSPAIRTVSRIFHGHRAFLREVAPTRSA